MSARAATSLEGQRTMRDATTRDALWVELVGLPGAGKTTVASLLPRRLAAHGLTSVPSDVSPSGRARAAYYARAAWFCASHPRLLTAALRYALAVRPIELRALGRLRVLLAAGLQLHAPRRAGDLVIAHQGALQELWSLAVHGRFPARARLASVLRQLYVGRRGRVAFVLLDIDAETAVERMQKRSGSGSRFQLLPPDAAASLLGTLQGRMEVLVASAADVAHAPALRVDAVEEPGEVCEHIALFVGDLAGVARRPSRSSTPREGPQHLVHPEMAP